MSVTILCTQLPRLEEQLRLSVENSIAYLLNTLIQVPCKSYNWLYSGANIQNIYQPAFYATDHSELLPTGELEMDAGDSEPGPSGYWVVGRFGTSWGRVWGSSGGKSNSTDTFQYWNHWHGHTSPFKLNISPDNISLCLLFCVLSLPSSYSHCFHEVNYRLHLIGRHALSNG